jgi:hypothetical protein
LPIIDLTSSSIARGTIPALGSKLTKEPLAPNPVKLHLSRAADKKGVETSGPPSLALRMSWRRNIRPPLRPLGALRQRFPDKFLYIDEA